MISAFKEDWRQRNAFTADIICNMLEDCLGYSITRNFTERRDEASLKKKLREDFNRAIEKIEKAAHRKIRKLFKHNIFNYDLPSYSILHEDLFSEKTWQLLGLTPKQLITAAGVTGGGIGAALEIAAAGLTFGVFTAIGGLLGAGWAALGGGKRLAKTKVEGLNLGGQQIRIGPIANMQFMYVLLDRGLIFYSHIINWAHGRRDYPAGSSPSGQQINAGFTADWDDHTKALCHAFYKAVPSSDDERKKASRKALKALLQDVFSKISRSERRYGLVTPEP